MGLNTAKIDDFSGGANFVDDPHELLPNEFPFGTADVELIGRGQGIRRRRAMTKISTTGTLPTVGFSGIGSSDRKAIMSFLAYRVAGSTADSFIGSSDDGYVFTMPAGGGVATQRIASGGAVNGRTWAFQQSQDSGNVQYIWMMNGTSVPQRMVAGSGFISNWNGPPPNGKCLASWKNRMIVSGVPAQPQRVYYSDIANPESWPANNFIDIKSVDDEDDVVVGLEVIAENLLVFKQRSVWMIFDSTTFDNRRVGNVGATNPFCMCQLEELVYWVSDDGVYSTDGESINLESKNVGSLWTTLGGGLSANKSYFRITSLPPEGKIVVVLGAPTSMMVMDTRLKREDGQHPWFLHSANIRYTTCMATAQMSNRTAIVAVSQNNNDTNQEVFRLFDKESGADDYMFNDAIGIFQPRWISLEGGENMERIRRVNILARTNNVTGISGFVFAEHQDGTQESFTFNGPILGGTIQTMRIRPETRGLYHTMQLDLFGAETAVLEIEIKYRGGKEH